MSSPNARRGFHLLDLAALVVGYGMAALLVRAFWPSAAAETPAVVGVIGIIYLWLGLAMSGPLVLVRHRGGTIAAAPRSWAELAWLIIGFYWLGMTILLVPIRLRSSRIIDAGLLGVFPFLAGLALRVLSPRPKPVAEETSRPAWTHRAAIGLLASWPLAWLALILLGKTLP